MAAAAQTPGPARIRQGLATPDQVAALLEVTPATMAKWRTRGEGPPWIKVGRRILYRWTAVEKWMESRECGGR